MWRGSSRRCGGRKGASSLHVAGLVDLLRGQEGRLLVGVGGHDETGELGGDPLLGDHQRRQRPVDEALVLVAQLALPLVAIGLEADRPGVPLLLLPVAVEGLRIVQVDSRARMIADPACSCTRCVSRISISSKPAASSAPRNSGSVSAPATQPVQAAMSARVVSSISGSAITSETAK